jgi:hypothetical protein
VEISDDKLYDAKARFAVTLVSNSMYALWRNMMLLIGLSLRYVLPILTLFTEFVVTSFLFPFKKTLQTFYI